MTLAGVDTSHLKPIAIQSEEPSLSPRAFSIPSLHGVGDSHLEYRGAQTLLPNQSKFQEDIETDQCIVRVENGQEKVNFCVADVRKRLREHLHTPKKMFLRDPEDPSG